MTFNCVNCENITLALLQTLADILVLLTILAVSVSVLGRPIRPCYNTFSPVFLLLWQWSFEEWFHLLLLIKYIKS